MPRRVLTHPGDGGGRPGTGSSSGPAATVLVATGLLLASGAACGPDDGGARPRGLPAESTYVSAMARLALLDTTLTRAYEPSQLAVPLDSARRLVLAERNVQPRDLEAFAERWGDDPERMERVWRRIDEVSDSLRRAGWKPTLPAGRAAGDGAEEATSSAADTASDGGAAASASR